MSFKLLIKCCRGLVIERAKNQLSESAISAIVIVTKEAISTMLSSSTVALDSASFLSISLMIAHVIPPTCKGAKAEKTGSPR